MQNSIFAPEPRETRAMYFVFLVNFPLSKEVSIVKKVIVNNEQ